MLWLAMKELRARPLRALLTGIAAVIGVGLVSGTFVLLDTAGAAGNPDGDVEQVGRIVLVGGGVALIVAAFIINAAFTVILAQRARELALLRCLGAEGRQLRRLVRFEALIVGGAASILGMAFGVVVAAALRISVNSFASVERDVPGNLIVAPRTVIVSLVAGCAIVLMSALVPVRRAGRALPVAALRALPTDSGERKRGVRLTVGVLIVVTGITAVLLSVVTHAGLLLLPAGALTLAGIRLVGPWVMTSLVRLIVLPLPWRLHLAGDLARENAARYPARTAATSFALMIGLALVAALLVMSASTRAANVAEIERMADFQIVERVPPGATPSPIDPSVVARLEELPELSGVATIEYSEAVVAGDDAVVAAVEPAEFARVQDVEVIDGSFSALTSGGIAITDEIAAANDWGVGSALELALEDNSHVVTVRAVYRQNSYVGGTPDFVMGVAAYARMGGDEAVFDVYMRVGDGIAPATARAATERVTSGRGLVVEDRDDVRRGTVGMIESSTAIYLALTGLASLVGLFGIFNTMALSIVDRIREVGLLRAIGLDRRGIRLMVRGEAVIVAAMGTVLGIGVGTFFGWGAAKVLEHSSSPTLFTVPIGSLVLIGMLAAASGLAAAELPARWASGIDVLRAIAVE